MTVGFIILLLLFGFLLYKLRQRFMRTGDRNVGLLAIGFGVIELGFIAQVVADLFSIDIKAQIFGISSVIFVVLLNIFLIYTIRQIKIKKVGIIYSINSKGEEVELHYFIATKFRGTPKETDEMMYTAEVIAECEKKALFESNLKAELKKKKSVGIFMNT